jgi:hypothetical protein
MSILCKTPSIRDVIAFPKTGHGTDLLFESPAPARVEVPGQHGIKGAEHGDDEIGVNSNTGDGERPTGIDRVETLGGSTSGPAAPPI